MLLVAPSQGEVVLLTSRVGTQIQVCRPVPGGVAEVGGWGHYQARRGSAGIGATGRTRICRFCAVFLVTLLGLVASAEATDRPDSLSASFAPEVNNALATGRDIEEFRFSCGGEVEARVWQLWDENGRDRLKRGLIEKRLGEGGDTWALYDMEVLYRNLTSMALRCSRQKRLLEIADVLMPLFDGLEEIPGADGDQGWICRGGAVCDQRNGQLNKEVMLPSVQALGWLSEVAVSLATTETPGAELFIRNTIKIATSSLLRWGDARARARWRQLAAASAEDAADGGSSLFFNNKHTWQITILANVAGVVTRIPTLRALLAEEEWTQLAENMRLLLGLFEKRVSFRDAGPRLESGTISAEIDRGYRRLYADSRYAGYGGERPPGICEGGPVDKKIRLIIKPKEIPVVRDLGWDISHARSLVPAIRALNDNALALGAIYGFQSGALSSDVLGLRLAAQLVGHVWDGSTRRPLFSNYWNGTNGWYRVGFENKRGQCQPGYPPYGLTLSFLSGGYVEWQRYYPLLGRLGRTLYGMASATSPDDIKFVHKYYRRLADSQEQLAAFPSLVF